MGAWACGSVEAVQTGELSVEEGGGRLVLVGNRVGFGGNSLAECPRLQDLRVGAPAQEPGHHFERVVHLQGEQEPPVGEVLERAGIDYASMAEADRQAVLTEAIEQDATVVDLADTGGLSDTAAQVAEAARALVG